MKRPLWAPWRIEYIRSEKENGCFLCRIFAESNDRKNLILFRGKTGAVLMNRYPYTSGHVMVAPYRHAAGLNDLTAEEQCEFIALTTAAVETLKRALQPEGFNIGMNFGQAAGAGLEDHIHQHIVPRWNGDTNFMPVVGDTRVAPEALDATYEMLKNAFNEL